MNLMENQNRPNAEFGLHGAFKVDIYDKAGQLVESTDYFNNFITQTGLFYPYRYNFADCFRFLSLGINGGANTMGTAGLHGSAVTALCKEGGKQTNHWQTWSYLGLNTLDKHGSASAGSCGTIVEAAGPAWYRGWVLPTGANSFLEADTSISEFVVSPSSGDDLSGKFAFSRVPRSVLIPSGTRTIVTYRLQVKIKHTGLNYFYKDTFNTGDAEVSEYHHLVSGFANLSGYYRQCYHGLRCVDNQGITFIPKYGDPLEPSNTKLKNIAIYFSPDNSQFDVNKFGGGLTNASSSTETLRLKAESGSYQTDGLLALSFNHSLNVDANVPENNYYNNSEMSLSAFPEDSNSIFKLAKDIRLKPLSSEKPPRLSDYSKSTTSNVDLNSSSYDFLKEGDLGNLAVSMSTFGKEGFIEGDFDRGFLATHSSLMSNLGVNFDSFTGRKRQITRKAFITPINALGHNSRFASLVYAYKNGATYYPAVDCMFFDSSGRSVMQHYRKFKTCNLTDRGRGILDCTLTTNPRTFGPFHVKTIQGPIIKDSLKSYISGYSGFYEQTQETKLNQYGYTETVTVPPRATLIPGDIEIGYEAPGNLGPKSLESNPKIGYLHSGKFGINPTNLNDRPYYGFGAVQGHLLLKNSLGNQDSSLYDNGIVNHQIEIRVPISPTDPEYSSSNTSKVVRNAEPLLGKYPESTGKLYWPTVQHNELKLATEGLTYYSPGIGPVIDNGGYFQRGGQQMVTDVLLLPTGHLFSGLKTPIVDANNPYSYLNLESITQNCFLCDEPGHAEQYGFLLTRATGDVNGGYTGTFLNDGNSSASTNLRTSLKDLFGGADQYKNPITGYIVNKATYGKYILNSTWVGGATGQAQAESEPALSPINAIMFPVDLKQEIIYVGNKVSDHQISGASINKFFDGFGSYPTLNLASRLSGKGYGTDASKDLAVFFTGFVSGTTNPLYLMSTVTTATQGTDFDGRYTCQVVPQVRMTDFVPPKGYFIHQEANRLLPNFALGQVGNDAYIREEIKQGGVYPGMSTFNTLEVFMNITWSAPCAGVVGCVEE